MDDDQVPFSSYDEVPLDEMADWVENLIWWGNGCMLTLALPDETLEFRLLEENRQAAVAAVRAAAVRARSTA